MITLKFFVSYTVLSVILMNLFLIQLFGNVIESLPKSHGGLEKSKTNTIWFKYFSSWFRL